jgi:DNA-binding response OmpR family regulator
LLLLLNRGILDALKFERTKNMANKLKVLVVEDEDALRMIVTDELALHGYEVDEAEDGVVALEKLSKTHFDLVILDIHMPNMDGMEVLKSIRKNNLADKVIMLTAVDELKVAQESLKFGANDFITKPYDFRNLIACINRVLKE